MFFNSWILFFAFISTSWGDPRPQNVGVIVPPTRPNSGSKETLYDPDGKKQAPTRLPTGVNTPTQLLYGKGTVVSSQKKPAGNTGKIVIHQSPSFSPDSSQQQERPSQHSLHLDIANIISHLIGGTTSQNPLADLSDLPSNADMNIQIVQPFYTPQRPAGFFYPPTSYQYGPRPMAFQQQTGVRPMAFQQQTGVRPGAFQPQRSFQSFAFSSFPRQASFSAGNDQDSDSETF